MKLVALVVAVSIVLAAGASPAAATPAQPLPPGPPVPASPARDPGTATTLSVGVTLVGLGAGILGLVDPWKHYLLVDGRYPCCPQRSTAGWTLLALGGAAFTFGPTSGHVYAGRTWNKGLALRVAALGGGLLGSVLVVGSPTTELGCKGTSCSLGVTLVLGSAIVYVVGTGVELGTAASSARRTNRARATGAQVGLGVLRSGDRAVPALTFAGAL